MDACVQSTLIILLLFSLLSIYLSDIITLPFQQPCCVNCCDSVCYGDINKLIPASSCTGQVRPHPRRRSNESANSFCYSGGVHTHTRWQHPTVASGNTDAAVCNAARHAFLLCFHIINEKKAIYLTMISIVTVTLCLNIQ